MNECKTLFTYEEQKLAIVALIPCRLDITQISAHAYPRPLKGSLRALFSYLVWVGECLFEDILKP